MKNLSVVGIGLTGIALLVILLVSYGYFIRPEATKAYSQFPTSGVFIAVVVGITIVATTLIVAKAWLDMHDLQLVATTEKQELKDELKRFIKAELATEIGTVQDGYQELVNQETTARGEAIEDQMFPKHKARIEYLLKLHEAHRKVTEELDHKGKIVKRITGDATLDLREEIKTLLTPESEELAKAIRGFNEAAAKLEKAEKENKPQV